MLFEQNLSVSERMLFYKLFYIVLFYSVSVYADTPANCTYDDALGRWVFNVCESENSCEKHETKSIILEYPNIAIGSNGERGHWTLIYNQGFEVTMAHRKWLVMFAFGPRGESYCHKGIPGWTHDTLLRQWKWASPSKVESRRARTTGSLQSVVDMNRMYTPNSDFVKQINAAQDSWQAVDYPEFSKFTHGDMLRRAGGMKSIFSKPNVPKKALELSPDMVQQLRALPKEFDWRNPPGGLRSPVSPIRNQGRCGSCYAFASSAALEARIRLASNFIHNPTLSPQDIVDCSPYSQGCEGGFPYLIAGKYAEDYGIPTEDCYPYKGSTGTCKTPVNCTRYYATNYAYIGGYYGASNEQLMQLELVHNGPFPVGFEVYDDFKHYKSGVYHRTFLTDSLNRFNPFVITNHAVVVVGYGVDSKTGLPYWAVQNSWGNGWGEKGFFRILRGSDECGIESLTVKFDPVL